MSGLRKLWKKDSVKTVAALALIIGIILGLYVSTQVALGVSVPLRVVESGSMCVQYDGNCDGWTHPFSHTLHVGDIIIIQKVDPTNLNANYPNSDIIVYKNPNSDTPIVHRIAAKQEINGTLYFKTKGDGNAAPNVWPNLPNYYDDIPTSNGVPQNLVEGKVVLRIPWFGLVTLFMRNNPWGLPLVLALIMLLIAVEFVIPVVRKKIKPAQQKPVK